MSPILVSVAVLGSLAIAGAVMLYYTSKKFHVPEDSRVAQIESHLAGANCGGCGLSGCHAFACKCVEQGNLEGLHCPGSPEGTLDKIAAILGCESSAESRSVAVLRCNGNCNNRTQLYNYEGAGNCAVLDATGVGTSGCSYGCLGCGDCVSVCPFGAIAIGEYGLPVIDHSICTGCGKCTTECPRNLLELRPEADCGMVWVACASRDRGAIARKICAGACIGCGKCLKECAFGAISVSDNLSYIDPDNCQGCSKCVGVCPTGAILTNYSLHATDKQA